MYRISLVLSLALAVGVGGCSSVPPAPAGASVATAGATSVKPGGYHCLRSTGSLIPPRPGECLPVAGHSYSSEDLRRTGAPRTADALRLLDPSIAVHSH